jgi:addiction module RelE/StbE family toxin
VTRLVWTRPALEDVQQIHDYIARDSPWYAHLVAQQLFAAVERLSAHPLSGRVVPELELATVREVIAALYRIVYRVRADVLEILTVVHSARRFPPPGLELER